MAASLQPTAYEQYMLELINRARANPLEEVARNSAVADLNEDLAPGTISASAKQPLAFNFDLIESSRLHSEWMLDVDVFSHTGVNDSTSRERMEAAGYVFTGYWCCGENISWQGTTGTPNEAQSIAIQHDNLFDSAGHRINLMNGNFKEVGVGSITGEFTTSDDKTFNSVMVTQNFGKTGSDTFLTGVIYTDAVLDDDFYTVGEAVSGVSIQAVRLSDNQVFSTTNFVSGGYSLALTPSTYNVSFSGSGLGQTVTETLTIGTENYKYDIATDLLQPAMPAMAAGQAIDLVWHNPVTGTIEAWAVASGMQISHATFSQSLASERWRIDGIGDFDGDGCADDVFWRQSGSGSNSIWFNDVTASGVETRGGKPLVQVPDLQWRMQGVGDFDQDGLRDDLVWFNPASKDVSVWYLNNGQPTHSSRFNVGSSLGDGWLLGGIGQFDSQGAHDDILWRNTITGDNLIWFMDGVVLQRSESLAKVADQNWQISGVADLDSDGLANDVVWHHSGTGATALWYTEGSQLTGGVNNLQPAQPAGYEVTA
jgi:uncharacterized protein YkwD